MSTAPRRPDLANEPVGRLMLRLSIPTITAQLVNMLYNLVDRIYISYIPDVGTLALTGLGVCLPIILLVSAFAALCASSGAPLASIAMGQRNHEKAEGILGSCTALLLCVSAVLTVVLSCFYTPILLAFGATEDALPYAQRYIAIYSLGTVFVQLSLGLNPFITAQGFSKAGMLTVLIGAVLNTLLDPLFIFVFHMDVQGAALATVISQAVSAAFVLRFLTGRQTILHLKRRLLRLNWKLLAPCVALGLAPFIMQSTESLVSVCFNTSLRAAGGTLAVGTMTICSTLMQFALLPLQGLSQGAQPIISFNYGAKRPERVKAAFRILLISCLAFSAVLGLTCIFAPQIFVYLLTPDAALREYAIPCVRLYMAGVTIFGAQIACQQTFVALGRFLSGVAAKKLTPWQIIFISMGILGVSQTTLLVSGNNVLTMAALLMTGLGVGPLYPNFNYMTPLHFGKDVSQSVMGMQMTFASIGTIAAPALCGVLGQLLGMGIFPAYLMIFYVLTAVGIIALRRTLRQVGRLQQ